MLDKFYVDTQLLVQAEDVRPELEGGRDDPSTGGSRSVVVHSKPNPRLPTKDWGLDRWKGLSELLHEQKIAIRQVGAKEEPLLPFAEDLRGTPPAELPPIVAGSAAVICLVGFLMHLAEAVGTPTIVIYGGREHPAIDGYPDQIHLASSPLACRGRWGCHLGPDITCPHDMKCMNGLTPELVASTLLTILEPQNEGRRP
jgi:ADP-heptose:LPS heptosyltransferase